MGLRQGPVERLKAKSVDPAILIQPEEIAEAVLFLLDTPPSAVVTAITLHSQQHNVAAIKRHADRFLEEHRVLLAKY